MPRGKSPQQRQKDFSVVPGPVIERSKFNRSHGYKTTMDAGLLYPFLVDECLPGDTVSLNATAFGRLSTPLHPVMENLYLDTFYFSIPYRLIWDNFPKFMGEQENPGDSTSFLVPQVVADAVTGFAELSLHDFMGVPTKVPGLSVSALPQRAYMLVWNEWFRSTAVQDSLVIERGDGPDIDQSFLQRRNKRHDFFSSALPWAQRGPAVSLPIGQTAQVIPDPDTLAVPTFNIFDNLNKPLHADATTPGTKQTLVQLDNGGGTLTQGLVWNEPNLVTDLTTATATTVNELREAVQLQRLYERDARGGTRLIEVVKSHFGVDSPDLRATRPEYLGGSSQRININPVAQTTQSIDNNAGDTPKGSLAAFGTVSGGAGGFHKSFTEHCVLLGLVMVRADLNYQQGVERQWSRQTRWDYYWPALAHLGEQEILNKEIYAQGPDVQTPELTPVDDEVFGYQERWAEYRYKPSRVTGQFRSNHSTPLDTWHLAQDFADLPVLNDEFLEENPPIDRIIAVPSEPALLLDVYFNMIAARPMPTYSTPGMLDHF